MVRDLLPDCDGSLKIGVAVVEDFPKSAIVLPSLGYQVLKIYPPERFSNYGRFWSQGDISWRVEVDEIEARVIYQWNRVESGNDLNPAS